MAVIIALRPAALSFRLGFADFGGTECDEGAACFLDAAHLLRCASAMRFRTAVDIWRLRFIGGGTAPSVEAPVNICRRIGNLCLDPLLLFFETGDSGGKNFSREFCGHVDPYLSDED